MSMSKKDYIFFAEMISNSEEDTTDIKEELIKYLKQDNPNFKEETFRTACNKKS
jgi:hypothetical protein